MKIRLLLVAEPGAARDAYMAVLGGLPVEVDCIGSPAEISGALVDAGFNGLIVDVPTMIRCECGDKNRITRIMERFPVLRVMYSAAGGGIRGLSQGGTLRDNRDLVEFVEGECCSFSPRSIRVVRRQEVVFNVLLLRDKNGDEDGVERTVTTNVSEHGCFIFTIGDWPLLSSAWIVIHEFEDKTPMELLVRWQRPWGTEGRMPGIGVSFESMTAYQYAQLHSYI
ncbi:PilZ domain-containing protein [Pseudodesulfovibrio sp.]|uniref:PilZ domain-containing protein n=1 Tax=unclassified Pseudodesulfovibrio TaxID=2661612 RepID=UPI003B007AF7